jgi:hypothetical protein
MFGQIRPWLDCDRNCEFCYLRENKIGTTLAEKKERLMKITRLIYGEMMDNDTIGLIGGELFCFDGLDSEWRCVADSLKLSQAKRIMLGTHLLSGVDRMIKFAKMLRPKDVQFCTSYDSKGRFKEGEYELWLENMEKVHEAGFKVVCSCTMTDEFVNDPIELPEWVEFKIQSVFTTEEWLDNILSEQITPEHYNECLKKTVNVNLAKREDALRWFMKHPKAAKSYSQYVYEHASRIWDFKKGQYVSKEFICNVPAPCGHPYIAYCYGDSCKCSMCDAEKSI